MEEYKVIKEPANEEKKEDVNEEVQPEVKIEEPVEEPKVEEVDHYSQLNESIRSLEAKLAANETKIDALQECNNRLVEMFHDLFSEFTQLNQAVELYRNRDIEHTERITKLEKCQKFDDNKVMAMELIRLRNITFKKLKQAKTENETELLNVMLKHLDVSLSRVNVKSFESKEGDTFDPSRSSVIDVVPTNDKKFYGKVFKSEEPGYYVEYFTDNEVKVIVINYEKVTVYQNKGEKL